ncbi:MAG TPA: hypothetical protein VMG82_07680 [Candidatus Sulfotelmatobacter sp.]|nr:hypothetical protein [Candidatus Sulfotelmatobacter sp.]
MPSGYRADHVGSLLRPPALLRARQSSTDGEQLRKIEDEFIALSPQGGFASTAEGNLLSEEDQWAKLKLVVATAREVWQ